jgi:phosphoglycolate phosphatase
MIRFAVFDLDGTLVDSRQDLADAANALVVERGGGALSEESIVAMVGEGAAVLVRRVLAAAGLDPASPGALERFLDFYDQRLLEHTQPYDGTEAMLTALSARMPLAVLTNKPQAHTERVLRGLDLARFFQDVIGGDTPLGRKPDPAGLGELARRAGVAVADTVLIGDSPIDLETARRAGCPAVLVRYGFGYRETDLRPGERVVGSVDELATVLR